ITKTRKDGSKRYQVRMRLNGRQKTKTFKRKTDADEHLNKNSNAVHEGTYRELKKARFEVFLKHWKEINLIPQKLKGTTINGYVWQLDRHIVPFFSGYSMTAITESEILEFETKLQMQGLSSVTVLSVHVLLS